MCIIGVVYSMIFAGTYLAFGVHPYRFILFFSFMTFYPSFGIVLLVFVYHKQNYNSSVDAGSGNSKSNKLTGAPTDSQIQSPVISGNVRFSSKESEVVSQHHIQWSIVVPENPANQDDWTRKNDLNYLGEFCMDFQVFAFSLVNNESCSHKQQLLRSKKV